MAAIGAEEALRHGMVNEVVPRDQLESRTLEVAEHIARRTSCRCLNSTFDSAVQTSDFTMSA